MALADGFHNGLNSTSIPDNATNYYCPEETSCSMSAATASIFARLRFNRFQKSTGTSVCLPSTTSIIAPLPGPITIIKQPPRPATRDPRPATTQVGALSTPLEQRCWQRQYLLIFKLMLLSEGDPLYSERGLGKSVDFINGNSLLSLVDPGLLKCRSR